MADNTIIQQGYFISDGKDKYIPLRSDVDWIEVYNLTNIAGNTQWVGCTWNWQAEMAEDDALTQYHGAATQASYYSTSAIGYNGATYRGVRSINSATMTPGSTVAVTAGTNVTQPVYSTGDTTRLFAGAIVRIQNTAHKNLDGLDFSIDTVTHNTSFRLANTIQQAPGVVAGAAGTYRYIAPSREVYDLFYPKKRVIANITQANPAVVTTLVDHGYVTGQKLRMIVPAVCGMTELNGQEVTVTNINASTFSIGIDTAAGYTAFAFPLAAAVPFTPAQVVPMGISMSANTSLETALKNTGFIGVILGTSVNAAVALGSPGGTTNDAIKWRAGKSFATHIG